VLGAKSPIGKDTKVYTEYQWEDPRRAAARSRSPAAAPVGPDPRLKLLFSGEAANVHADSGDSKRTALAGGVTYDTGKGLRALSRQEIRLDDSTGRRKQYFTVNQLDYTVHPDVTLLARFRFSRTENRTSGATDADFDERVLGAAYRPVHHQRFNALFKYTSLSEQHPASSVTRSPVRAARTSFRSTRRSAPLPGSSGSRRRPCGSRMRPRCAPRASS
jgi:hypothetical protein